MRLNRRRFLAAAGLTSLAGCTSPSDVSTETSTATGTPTPTPGPSYDVSVAHDVESWAKYNPDWSHPTDPPDTSVKVETVVEGLKIPWDLSFAPNGELFISQRTGTILRYDAGTVQSVASPDDIVDASAIGTDEKGGWWAAGGEGGLMGIAAHPNYPDVPLVYAFYTYLETTTS